MRKHQRTRKRSGPLAQDEHAEDVVKLALNPRMDLAAAGAAAAKTAWTF